MIRRATIFSFLILFGAASLCAEPSEEFLAERDLFLTAPQLESQVVRKESLLFESDRDRLDVVLRRTRALLEDLTANPKTPDLSAQADKIATLEEANQNTSLTDTARRLKLLDQARNLRRSIAFSNPLLDFDKIAFLKHHKAVGNEFVGKDSHMCDQYYGFSVPQGGGVFVLEDAFGEAPVARDVLADAVVQNGSFAGKSLPGGSYLSMDLDYDGENFLFAWTQAKPTLYEWSEESVYHIFKAGVDGSNLTQLTEGAWNDFDPCFMPSGRISFISERRGGYLRCGVRPDPTYTVHDMAADGSDIKTLSFHETHEWHPSVDNVGMLVYTRWDYVDRDTNAAHHIWLSYPDGRDPRSFHGNYPVLRESRPWMEMSIRAVPDSHKYVAVAAPHHGQAYGSIVLIDQRLEDDRAMSQVLRVTPKVLFPESELAPGVPGDGVNGKRGVTTEAEVFGTPWPLSEDYYLCVYDPDGKNYGVYLIDTFGNEELLYRDESIPCLDPIPLRPRPRPPVLHSPYTANGDTTGTVAVINVYDSELDWPEGTEIEALRVVQLFPKTTPSVEKPNIGVGQQALARGVLGTVPVEEDGSAYFEAPAEVALYFQALDADGLAVQSMRSDTYLHPGEHLTCQGCHEPKRQAITASAQASPIAVQRPPSKIQPEAEGSYPLLYPKLVQGVLDRHCVECHAEDDSAINLGSHVVGKFGWTESYEALAPFTWTRHGTNGGIEDNGSSRSIPGEVGARASKLYEILTEGHYDIDLPPEDWRRLTLWLDCNSNFYGVYHDIEKQAVGVAVAPILE